MAKSSSNIDKVVNLKELIDFLEEHKERMDNGMLMGIWIYKVKKFIEKCPDFEQPFTDFEIIEERKK